MFNFRDEQRRSAFIKELIQKLSSIKKDFLVPLGIGIIISAILMNISFTSKAKRNIEDEARKLGMVYPAEIKNVEINSRKD